MSVRLIVKDGGSAVGCTELGLNGLAVLSVGVASNLILDHLDFLFLFTRVALGFWLALGLGWALWGTLRLGWALWGTLGFRFALGFTCRCASHKGPQHEEEIQNSQDDRNDNQSDHGVSFSGAPQASVVEEPPQQHIDKTHNKANEEGHSGSNVPSHSW